jgi:hypothetical protein
MNKIFMRKRTTPLTYITAENLAVVCALLDGKAGKVLMRKEPQDVRTSAMASVYDCDFGAVFKMLDFHTNEENNTDTDATAIGTAFHKVLEESQGRRFPHEQFFVEKLKQFEDPKRGLVRVFECSNGKRYNICAHPDDLQVGIDDVISNMEYKTCSIKDFAFIVRWKFPCAKFQSCIYTWVWSSFLPQINQMTDVRERDVHYRVNECHGVTYYDPDTFHELGYPLKVYYDEQRVVKDMDRALCLLENWELCIAPNPFKCQRCARDVKTKCPNPLKCGEHSNTPCFRYYNREDKQKVDYPTRCEGCTNAAVKPA